MRKLLILLTFIIVAMGVQSQTYVALGYNAATPLKFQRFDYIIDNYNYNHPNLTKTMEYINFLQGFTMTSGYRYHGLFAEVSYRGATQTAEASYNDDNGFATTRELRARFRTLDISVGICAPFYDWNFFALGCGVSVGNFSIKTRSVASYATNARWSDNLIRHGNTIFSYNFFVRYSPYGGLICLEPYVSITPSKFLGIDMMADLQSVNANLNPGTYQGSTEKLDAITGHAGMKIIVIIPFGKDE